MLQSFSADHSLRLQRAKERVRQQQKFSYTIVHEQPKTQHFEVTVSGIWDKQQLLGLEQSLTSCLRYNYYGGLLFLD
jgi:tetrahydromethanopterin S-methyltransferase subunit F